MALSYHSKEGTSGIKPIEIIIKLIRIRIRIRDKIRIRIRDKMMVIIVMIKGVNQ